MTKQRKLLLALSGFVVLAVAAFAGWYLFLRSDAPPAVTLDDAIAAVTSTTGTVTTDAAPASTTTPAPATTNTPGTTAANLASPGNWVLDGSGTSFVGYRVQEELAQIGATTAVGRTTSVEGSLQLEGSTVSAVEVVADMTALQSDNDRRDRFLRDRSLETNAFPQAGFSLTSRIDLGQEPAEGVALQATAVGELTLHGVTRPVEVALEAQLVDGVIVVIGSVPITFGDYNIAQPSSFAVLSVDDNGVMEFQLVFEPA